MDRETDRQSDWTKLIAAFRNLAKVSKTERNFLSNATRFWEVYCFPEISDDFPISPSVKSNTPMKFSVEHWWNDTERRKGSAGRKHATLQLRP